MHFLVVGLGNPGPEYQNTPHNLGFKVVDELIRLLPPCEPKKKFKAEVYTYSAPPQFSKGTLTLLKPMTYMNLSGSSVQETVHFFKLNPGKDMLIISDDLDLPPGQIRLRLKGGPGGHNGLRSIIEQLGTDDFPRLRIGIGRSAQIPADQYVLATIPSNQTLTFKEAVDKAVQAVLFSLEAGVEIAMNQYNVRPEPNVKDPK